MDSTSTLHDEPVAAPGAIGVAHGTHVGAVRKQNQDAAWSLSTGERAVLVVADGMGGHRGGADASAAATQIIEAALRSEGLEGHADMTDIFERVSDKVSAAAPDGGTTLVAAIISPASLEVWHVGDSRAYVLRDGALMPVTTDHSWVQTLVEGGRLTREQAAGHPRRNVLLRAIGRGRDSTPEHSALRFLPGDKVLLCSDGLHGVVPEVEVARILDASDDAQQTVHALIEAALRRGAPDNVGVAVAFQCSQ